MKKYGFSLKYFSTSFSVSSVTTIYKSSSKSCLWSYTVPWNCRLFCTKNARGIQF